MLNNLRLAALCSCAFIGLSACATGESPTRGQTGAAVGAVTGAVLGHQVDGEKGRFVGALVGAIAGNAVGRYMDEQQRELERELSKERAADEIKITRLPDKSLRLDVSNEVSFDFDSSMIKVGFRGSLNKMAGILADYPNTVVHIIGHTDNVGTEKYNQDLSLRRAGSVSSYLISKGVDARRSRKQGFGETMPIASNSTAQGRQRNRRVEIYIKPIVDGREADAFLSPV